MQENINIPDSTITTNLSFRNLVLMNMQQLTNFPYIEKDFDALTDYELLCLIVKFLNDVIANQNEQNASITRMYESFLTLQTYVNNTKDELEDAFNNLDDYVRNYFDNLDVQDEINNKLDQMLKDGELEQIIEQFIQSNALWCFDTVADMKLATNLINGSYAKTLGYYAVSDGGGATYKIRTKTLSDTPNDMDIIAIGDTLVAELIVNKNLSIKQLGAYVDGEHNDTNRFTTFLNLGGTKLDTGNYLFTNFTKIIRKNIIIDLNNSNVVINKTTSSEAYEHIFYLPDNNDIGVINGNITINVSSGLFPNDGANRYIIIRTNGKVLFDNINMTINNNANQVNLLNGGGHRGDFICTNSKFIYSHETANGGLFWFGAKLNEKQRIYIDNVYAEHNTPDEIFAVFGYGETTSDVSNSTFVQNLTTEHAEVMINSYCEENGTKQYLNFNNCKFISKETAKMSAFIKNFIKPTHTDSYSIINFEDCYFDITHATCFNGGEPKVAFADIKTSIQHFQTNLRGCNINIADGKLTNPSLYGSNAKFDNCKIYVTDNNCVLGYDEYTKTVMPKQLIFHNCEITNPNINDDSTRFNLGVYMPAQCHQVIFDKCSITNYDLTDLANHSIFVFNKNNYHPTLTFSAYNFITFKQCVNQYYANDTNGYNHETLE